MPLTINSKRTCSKPTKVLNGLHVHRATTYASTLNLLKKQVGNNLTFSQAWYWIDVGEKILKQVQENTALHDTCPPQQCGETSDRGYT